MSDQRPSPPSIPDDLLTRRRLVTGIGFGLISLAAAPPVVGHDDDDHDDDDHDDDSGRGRGRGRSGGDDDDVHPLGTVPAGSIEVRIDDDDAGGFEPGTVSIDAGQSVTWVNVDDDPHTATGAGFDTGIMQPGEHATVTFHQAGTFPYSCQIHPIMTGVVEVRDATGNASNATTGATPEASPQATPSSSGQQASVSIVNISFDPARLEVATGTTVTWTNDEAIPHTVTSSGDAFDSGTLEEGERFQHTFDTAGVFDYVCAIHPNMQGTVIVTDWAYRRQSASSPTRPLQAPAACAATVSRPAQTTPGSPPP